MAYWKIVGKSTKHRTLAAAKKAAPTRRAQVVLRKMAGAQVLEERVCMLVGYGGRPVNAARAPRGVNLLRWSRARWVCQGEKGFPGVLRRKRKKA